MEEQMRRELEQAEVDVEGVLSRCMGNESLYIRLLSRFTKDRNFEELAEGMMGKDTEKAFRAAHTLKGICGNLGFDGLLPCVERLTEAFRQGELSEAERIFPEAEEKYAVLTAAIRRIGSC